MILQVIAMSTHIIPRIEFGSTRPAQRARYISETLNHIAVAANTSEKAQSTATGHPKAAQLARKADARTLVPPTHPT